MRVYNAFAVSAILASQLANAIDLKVGDQSSLKSAAKTIAEDLVKGYYTGKSDIPGLLPDKPYYWWQAGAMWDGLINYWYLTGDSQFNSITSEGLQFQVGPNNDYMPPNQTKSMGNDDQATWALAALSAAERQFPSPADKPQWLDLATAVFNNQVLRWDTKTCGGGLRWQIFSFNAGYNYKQSQEWFFLLSSRLAQFTKNTTYSDWAGKTYDWTKEHLMDNDFSVFDGTDVTTNCSQPNRLQWSYKQAAYIYGSAVMYNMTSSDVWRKRVEGHANRLATIFYHGAGNTTATKSGTILSETACESNGKCTSDMTFYKALTSRWISQAIISAPFLSDKLTPLIKSTATAAAKVCSGGSSGNECGLVWYTGEFDDQRGAGEQLSALEAIQANLNTPGKALASAGSPSASKPSGTATGTGATTSATGTDAPKNAGFAVKASWFAIMGGVAVALL